MSPQVAAAIIAGCVGVLTLIGTVIVQIVGFRSTKANTEEQIKATRTVTAETLRQQREQLDRTLTEQREQLDKTLKAQGDQLEQTLAEQRTRTLNERFATAAEQLGSDKPAVRLAGVYAIAGLADDWNEDRQTCVDVLCAYLRMPYEPEPGDNAPAVERLAYLGNREVRHTVIRVIADHLRDGASVSWRGQDLDFTGAIFDGGNFQHCVFSGGEVRFNDSKFVGEVSFSHSVFSGGVASFHSAEFCGAVNFNAVEFSGGEVYFYFAKFSGGIMNFMGAKFSCGEVPFDYAIFSDGLITFDRAKFSGGKVSFNDALFTGGTATFGGAEFSAGTVTFRGTEFSRGTVTFASEFLSTSTVSESRKAIPGGETTLKDRESIFSGAKVDFSEVADWSHPPTFSWTGRPPAGIKLPPTKTSTPRSGRPANSSRAGADKRRKFPNK
jgi:uncharacterized protein YjbI with pentapeptide repeats